MKRYTHTRLSPVNSVACPHYRKWSWRLFKGNVASRSRQLNILIFASNLFKLPVDHDLALRTKQQQWRRANVFLHKLPLEIGDDIYISLAQEVRKIGSPPPALNLRLLIATHLLPIFPPKSKTTPFALKTTSIRKLLTPQCSSGWRSNLITTPGTLSMVALFFLVVINAESSIDLFRWN
jgi:hypothetical protein